MPEESPHEILYVYPKRTNFHITWKRGQGPAEVDGTHSTDEHLAVGTLRVLLHTLSPCIPLGSTANSKQRLSHLHGAGSLVTIAGGSV